MNDRFTGDAAAVLDVADVEAARCGCGYLGEEHVLIALFIVAPRAVAPLIAAGMTAHSVRDELSRLALAGGLPGRPPGSIDALGSVGIDRVEVVRSLEDAFGTEAVLAAVRKVERRRGRRAGSSADDLCGRVVLVKYAVERVACFVDELRQAWVSATSLTYALLMVIDEPLATHLSRRGRHDLACLGFARRARRPTRLVLDGHGVDATATARDVRALLESEGLV